MQISAEQLTMVFQRDLPGILIGTVLCTIGLGFALFSPRSARRDLITAGLFAFSYGFRMLVRSGTMAHLLGHPHALPYIASACEYLVPIPASLLFLRYFGRRRRWLDLAAVGTLICVAVVAIPYEIVTAQPGAGNRVESAVVIGLIGIVIANLVFRPTVVLRWTPVWAGGLIFCAFVLNEHFRLVRAPLQLAREPIGFLIFVGTILWDLLRVSERARWRLATVESELATARLIQESILPEHVPATMALDVASVYQPASSVAGDFYDFVDMGAGRWAVAVADVSGHGVGAALVSSMLKVAIEMETPLARDPAELLHALNAFFCGRLKRQFITAVVAFFETDTGVVTLASAGHPPPIVRRAGGMAEEVAISGFVLGRMRTASYQTTSLTLALGEALVFHTDGISEARRSGDQQFGTERLVHAIARAGDGARAIADAIIGDLIAWSGRTELEDDVTLVVVRRS